LSYGTASLTEIQLVLTARHYMSSGVNLAGIVRDAGADYGGLMGRGVGCWLVPLPTRGRIWGVSSPEMC